MGALDICLSVDEIALVMSTAGCPDSAHDLLVAQLQIAADFDARQRLESAAGALLARNLLIRTTQGKLVLSETLREVAGVMCSADYGIRCQHVDSRGEALMTIHSWNEQFYVHTIRDKFVHCLRRLEDRLALVNAALDFLNLVPYTGTSTSFSIPEQVLEVPMLVRDIAAIVDPGSDPRAMEDATSFIADLSSPASKGSILRVDYVKGEENTAEAGFLLLGGTERHWLLQTSSCGGSGNLDVTRITAESFSTAVQSLVDDGHDQNGRQQLC